MDRSGLVKLFGYRAAFLHGDTLMLDRWRWATARLPETRNGEQLLDAGCGTGAFTIGAAKRGYRATGLSWDERNQRVATERAAIAGVPEVAFPIGDVRRLDEHAELRGRFDVVLSFENIEHVLDDAKLMRDLAECLKPGGWLLLTTPNHYYRAFDPRDRGPFSREEDGWHVRRGYTGEMLRELAAAAGLRVEEVSSCSGWFSQQVTRLMRRRGLAGWAATLPLRVLPGLFDRAIRRLTGWPDYSICMVALKPRLAPDGKPRLAPGGLREGAGWIT